MPMMLAQWLIGLMIGYYNPSWWSPCDMEEQETTCGSTI